MKAVACIALLLVAAAFAAEQEKTQAKRQVLLGAGYYPGAYYGSYGYPYYGGYGLGYTGYGSGAHVIGKRSAEVCCLSITYFKINEAINQL